MRATRLPAVTLLAGGTELLEKSTLPNAPPSQSHATAVTHRAGAFSSMNTSDRHRKMGSYHI